MGCTADLIKVEARDSSLARRVTWAEPTGIGFIGRENNESTMKFILMDSKVSGVRNRYSRGYDFLITCKSVTVNQIKLPVPHK